MSDIQSHNSGDSHFKTRLHLSESDLFFDEEIKNIFNAESQQMNVYPDPSNEELIRKISQQHNIEPEFVFVGNGLDEVTFLICTAHLSEMDSIVCSENCFPGYSMAAAANRANTINVPLDNFYAVPEKYIESADSTTKLAFLCNPLNPCGTIVSKERILKMVELFNKKGVICIIDEAYINFSEPDKYSVSDSVSKHENLIVLRSLSKSHGIAGLRLGYALGRKEAMDRVKSVANALPFRVNRVAQKVGEYVISNNHRVKEISCQSKILIEYMQNELQIRNINFIPSNTNFIFFDTTGFPSCFVSELHKKSVAVRDCTSFGFKGWIRASFRSMYDTVIFLKILDNFIE